tara:strand:- start:242 stop:889 length:648 start_codon:yes stop_codon:yes gene_type:complete
MALESKKSKSERAAQIYAQLKHDYPGLSTFLTHKNPFELLIAVILSAQCTDERVNLTTPDLFNAFPTAERLMNGDLELITELLSSINYYKTKAKNIQKTATILVEKFGGVVPDTLDDLIILPGVGRKTANVVLGQAFGKPGITVDTHLKRLCQRMGFTKQQDAVKVEFDLQKIWDSSIWSDFSTLLIFHGRQICKARKPLCEECNVNQICLKKFI